MYLPLEQIAIYLDSYTFLRDVLQIRHVRKLGHEITMECPNPFHVDKNPSCSLNPIWLIWHCFGCHAKGTILDLIRTKLECDDNDEARDFLIHHVGLDKSERVSEIVVSKAFDDGSRKYELSYHYDRDFKNANADILAFVQRRNFNLDLFKKYYIGFNNNLNSITLPVIHSQRIVNIGERFVFPSDPARKIMYKKGSRMAYCLWGLFDGYSQDDPVFTEGIFDSTRNIEAGMNSFALLSNQLPRDKIKLILDHFPNAKSFTICPDNDAGGKEMINAWIPMLHYKEIYVMDVSPYKDSDEAPIDILRKSYINRVRLRDKIFTSTPKDYVCSDIRR